jgi:hypothetical protein
VQSGAVSHAVAASLGHGSFEMTARHYAQPEVISSVRTTRVVALLELDSSQDSLLQLPAEQLMARLPEQTLRALVTLWTKKNERADR